MGYKMPNVVKEIYIPLSEKYLNTDPTLDQYKEKYGIDLEEVLGLHVEQGHIPTMDLPLNTKIYFVAEDYEDLYMYAFKVAIPNSYKEDGESKTCTIACISFDSLSGNANTGFGIVIGDDKVLNAFSV